ncbi:hypothetical protein C0033_19225 [Clostridium sp. chh4-2]|uniref:tripartite tricarboxylate transporter substrate binding protein n=1 Tax=Clostridium sp. chh4-2 TaxID=2067550 RepID=UPI000CCEA65B|nr:tripartite tricarboxylate transporter substrate binding protein [Clostridium sp. chh4-2]PNV60408.1 hypothetical protein C0033_19225 [Clostridium sp. chh4-2]
MNMKKTALLILAGGMALALAACSSGGSQKNTKQVTNENSDVNYPDGDLRIQVPFKTGGALDVQVRTTVQYLSKELGVNVIVENTAGAGGQLGTTEYLKEPANTSTILLTDGWLMTVTPMISSVQYSIDEYMPIIDHNIIDFCLFACPSKSGINNIDDLKTYGADNRVLFGSGGAGTSLYVVQKSLLDAMGVQSDTISQNSTSEGMGNLMAGTVDVTLSSFTDAADYVANGDIVPILWFGKETYKDDDVYAQGVPCAKEQGIEIDYQGFTYYSIRKGTDEKVIEKLQNAFTAVYENPEFKEECKKIGFAPTGMKTEEINSYLKAYTEMADKNFTLE